MVKLIIYTVLMMHPPFQEMQAVKQAKMLSGN